MHPYEVEEKLRSLGGKLAGCDTAQTQVNQAMGKGLGAYMPTLREQAEKNVGYHREQADKHNRAVAFFRDNPAFDEFIQLIRSGAIQL